MIALLALMLAAPEDKPVVTPAVTEALTRFGDIARASVEPGANRVFAAAGCGNGWTAYSLEWKRPEDKGTRRWGPPKKAPPLDAPRPDEDLTTALQQLCASFEAQLTEDQYFEVDWSLANGVVSRNIEPLKDLKSANWDNDAQAHKLAFFGTTADQSIVVPRKSRR